MATTAQIEANRRNAQLRVPPGCGPRTEAGKARSCTNRLSHGFTSSVLFIADEELEEFNLLLADLHNEFQPATASEQMILEKIVQNQWLALRAYRLQSVALNAPAAPGYVHPDLSLLVRYHQSSDRGFYKARTELINAQKQRQKSEIGFESQDIPKIADNGRRITDDVPLEIGFESQETAKPAEKPAQQPAPPHPPQETTPKPGLSIPAPPAWNEFDSLEDQLETLTHGPDGEIAKQRIAAWKARRKLTTDNG